MSVCLCAPAYVYTSTEVFGSIFKVNLGSWKSASLSSHVSVWIKVNCLSFIYSNMEVLRVGWGGRCYLCLRKKELHLISFVQCLLTFLSSCLVHAWSPMNRLPSRCRRPAVGMHISTRIPRCKTPPSEENILLGMASPGSPLVILRSWMVHKMPAVICCAGSLSSTRIKLASSSWDQKGAWPVCPLRAKAIRRMFSRTLEWVSVKDWNNPYLKIRVCCKRQSGLLPALKQVKAQKWFAAWVSVKLLTFKLFKFYWVVNAARALRPRRSKFVNCFKSK